MNRFICFAFVGCMGFGVDMLIFNSLYYVLHADIVIARLIAFVFAVNTTWFGNRFITFKTRYKQNTKEIVQEWIKFILVACTSLLPNLLVFKVLVNYSNSTHIMVNFAFVVGVLVGMLTNYIFCSKWVFVKN